MGCRELHDDSSVVGSPTANTWARELARESLWVRSTVTDSATAVNLNQIVPKPERLLMQVNGGSLGDEVAVWLVK
jgi:hypothetical protein